MHERTIVFDIGGVLRRVHKANRPPGEATRNYGAARALYRTMVESRTWRVVVVTGRDGRLDRHTVGVELAGMGLPAPDEIIVTAEDADKSSAYRQVLPDIVVDDAQFRCEAARKAGALALRPL